MLKVLVIDDIKYYCDDLCEILEMQGYRAYAAPSGKAALRSLDSFAPDVIVCDVLMPGATGFDVLAAVRSHPCFSETTFILMSAVNLEDQTVATNHLWDAYLVKPFSPQDLLRTIARLVGQPHSRAS